jgi:predicted TPR repeat methyltransferase
MMDVNHQQARQFFLEGVQHYQAGRYAQAEQKFAASLALVPGRASALINLGAARLKLGRAEEALAVLDEALAQEPDSVEVLSHRGTALAELGRLQEALASLDRSLALNPQQGLAWSHRGSVLRDLERRDEAIASFEQAIAHGADPALNAYYLASLRGGAAAPPAPPRQYVQALFDGYARDFNQHLQQLHYDAPAVLARHVGASGRRFRHALDLGCGTGLCGQLLKPVCAAIDGIDLSGAMLDQAQALSVYQLLEQADAAEFMAVTERRYDLVVAADVFIYVGALEPVFEGVARVLEPGGLFGFTVEEAEEDFVLRPSLRYAHSEDYLRRLAAQHGFDVQQVERRAVRQDRQTPIAGLFVWLSYTALRSA